MIELKINKIAYKNISHKFSQEYQSPICWAAPKKRSFTILTIVLSIFFAPQVVNAAKILGIFASSNDGHLIVFQTIMAELAKRDHNVTVLTSHHHNMDVQDSNQIVIRPVNDFREELLRLTNLEPHELPFISESEFQAAMNIIGSTSLNHFLSNFDTQKLISNVNDFSYDLIIVDIFYTEALLMLGKLHSCPVIGLVASNFENYMTNLLDYLVPSACSPIEFCSNFEGISFWKRIENILACLNRRKFYSKILAIQERDVLSKHFGHLGGKMPSLAETVTNTSVLLFNDYIPLQTPKPLLPNQIPVGGLHIRPPQVLPWNAKRFLDDARLGSIYINMGNFLKCSRIPKDRLQVIVNTLSKFKERVLWRCDDGLLHLNLSSNVMLQKNIPDADILAHPHVKYFVFDGDLLNLQEAIYRNVPVLGVPIFRDQNRNMDTVTKLGIGIKLSFFNLTEISFFSALNTLINERKFHITIREVSAVFRDRPLGALETTLYWIEYVLRHGGTSYIHATGMNIPWNQLYLLDLLSFAIIVLITLTLLLSLMFRIIMYIYHRRRTNKLNAKLK